MVVVNYGAVDLESNTRPAQSKLPPVSWSLMLAAAAGVLLLAAVVYNASTADTELLQYVRAVDLVPVMVVPRRTYEMLYDAALDPTYSGGSDPIDPYKWAGANAKFYDPEEQNAWADLPMKNADIKKADPSNEFEADKSMAKSCDKTGDCKEEENVWSYLPEEEEKSLKKREKDPAPEDNAWEKSPLDY